MIHTGGIGDFILACPAIAQLSRQEPVDLAGRPGRLALAVEAGIASTAHDLDAVDFPSVFAGPSQTLRAFLAPFERVVVWMRDDDGALRRGLKACGVSEVQAFPGLPPDGWQRHASEYYLDCLGFECGKEPFRLRLAPEPDDLDVVIHPGSGSPRKNWPLENFRRVAEGLERAGRRVTWSLGPAEEGFVMRPGESLLPRMSLVALGRRLAGARLYIGNDSGITHLAAVVGCPTVAVFGATDPKVWAPRGPRVTVVNAESDWGEWIKHTPSRS